MQRSKRRRKIDSAVSTTKPTIRHRSPGCSIGLRLLRVKDAGALDALMPQERSPGWRKLSYAIANQVILRQCLGLAEEQMKDYSRFWFTEDAEVAAESVRRGEATYAVLLDSLPVSTVPAMADAGERMPQKSTFFWPKAPTGALFNLLEE